MTGPGEPGAPAAILIGPPGAGKSTVGPLLAARLGVRFLDTDDRVEAVAGKPVSDIFIDDGEQAFRALEREAVAWAVSAPAVSSAAGSSASAAARSWTPARSGCWPGSPSSTWRPGSPPRPSG